MKKSFSKALEQFEIQTASSRIWTRLTDFNFYDDNLYKNKVVFQDNDHTLSLSANVDSDISNMNENVLERW